MRSYIRHPANIPIEISALDAPAPSQRRMKNISRGGLSCHYDRPLERGTSVRIWIPLVDDAFICECIVAWCRSATEGEYEIGLHFVREQDAYTGRMVAQICHIEAYRQQMSEASGTPVDSETAAREWITRYAHEFPGAEPDS